VVHTPGHTPGHVCLFGPEDGTLISGDHILPGETPNVAYYPIGGYGALRSYFASLRTVSKLAPRRALPAHGDVIKDVRARLEGLFVHHRERLLEVLGALPGSSRAVIEVTSSVRWSRGPYESLGHFDKWLAILETIAHLEFLVECGIVQRGSGRVRSYRLTNRDWSAVDKVMTGYMTV